MAFSRSLVAAVATLSLVKSTQAWNVELPPCLDEFQPFVYSGCFQDGTPGTPNALIFRSSLSSDSMTVEECVADCKGVFVLKLLLLIGLMAALAPDDELTLCFS